MEEFGNASMGGSTATLLALLATVITVASILASYLFSGISRKGCVVGKRTTMGIVLSRGKCPLRIRYLCHTD